MTLPQVHSPAMTLQQALLFSKQLAKHNPFVRLTPDEQILANNAGKILKEYADTEALQDLMKREEYLALF